MPHALLRLLTSALERLDALRRDGVFALCRDQFRAVHLEQRLSLADNLPGNADMQTLDVAFELRRDGVQTTFVRLNPTSHADDLVQHL